MAHVHSLDLRQRVIDYVLAGYEIKLVSALFCISRTAIYSWLHLLKTNGNLKPQQSNRRKGYKINAEAVSAYFIKSPDATLQEAADAFSTHVSTIWYICKNQKITRKKRLHITKNVTKRSDKNS